MPVSAVIAAALFSQGLSDIGAPVGQGGEIGGQGGEPTGVALPPTAIDPKKKKKKKKKAAEPTPTSAAQRRQEAFRARKVSGESAFEQIGTRPAFQGGLSPFDLLASRESARREASRSAEGRTPGAVGAVISDPQTKAEFNAATRTPFSSEITAGGVMVQGFPKLPTFPSGEPQELQPEVSQLRRLAGDKEAQRARAIATGSQLESGEGRLEFEGRTSVLLASGEIRAGRSGELELGADQVINLGLVKPGRNDPEGNLLAGLTAITGPLSAEERVDARKAIDTEMRVRGEVKSRIRQRLSNVKEIQTAANEQGSRITDLKKEQAQLVRKLRNMPSVARSDRAAIARASARVRDLSREIDISTRQFGDGGRSLIDRERKEMSELNRALTSRGGGLMEIAEMQILADRERDEAAEEKGLTEGQAFRAREARLRTVDADIRRFRGQARDFLEAQGAAKETKGQLPPDSTQVNELLGQNQNYQDLVSQRRRILKLNNPFIFTTEATSPTDAEIGIVTDALDRLPKDEDGNPVNEAGVVITFEQALLALRQNAGGQ